MAGGFFDASGTGSLTANDALDAAVRAKASEDAAAASAALAATFAPGPQGPVGATGATGPAGFSPYLDAIADCGLVGDGVTDDTAALLFCVGKRVFFPVPTYAYIITNEIPITTNTDWFFAGEGRDSGAGTRFFEILNGTATPSGFPLQAQIRWGSEEVNGENGTGISVTEERTKAMIRVSPNPVGVEPDRTKRIENVTLDGLALWGGILASGFVGFGLYVAGCNESNFRNMYIQQCENGVYFGQDFNLKQIHNIKTISNKRRGFVWGFDLTSSTPFDVEVPPAGEFTTDPGTGLKTGTTLAAYASWTAINGGHAVTSASPFGCRSNFNANSSEAININAFNDRDNTGIFENCGFLIVNAFATVFQNIAAENNSGAGIIMTDVGFGVGCRDVYVEGNSRAAALGGELRRAVREHGIIYLVTNDVPTTNKSGSQFLDNVYLNGQQSITVKGTTIVVEDVSATMETTGVAVTASSIGVTPAINDWIQVMSGPEIGEIKAIRSVDAGADTAVLWKPFTVDQIAGTLFRIIKGIDPKGVPFTMDKIHNGAGSGPYGFVCQEGISRAWFVFDNSNSIEPAKLAVDVTDGLVNGWAPIPVFGPITAGPNDLTTSGTGMTSTSHGLSVNDRVLLAAGAQDGEVRRVTVVGGANNVTLNRAFSTDQGSSVAWTKIAITSLVDEGKKLKAFREGNTIRLQGTIEHDPSEPSDNGLRGGDFILDLLDSSLRPFPDTFPVVVANPFDATLATPARANKAVVCNFEPVALIVEEFLNTSGGEQENATFMHINITYPIAEDID